MATIDYKQLATPEANLIELLSAQNQDGTYSAKLMGSEPFAVLAAKTIYNAYNDIEDNMAADVEGPASSTDNALARFDGTTGKLLQNSNAILTDAGALSLASNLTVSGTGTSTVSGGLNILSNSSATGSVDIGADARGSNLRLSLNAAAGNDREIITYTAGLQRWKIGVTGTAESGSNAGSNWILQAYADNGSTSLGNAISITRSTLATTLAGNLTVSGTANALGGTNTGNSEVLALRGSGTTAQLRIAGAGSDYVKYLAVGFNTTSNYGWIDANQAGIGVKPLVVNPSGGNFLVGTTIDRSNRLHLAAAGPSYIGMGQLTSTYAGIVFGDVTLADSASGFNIAGNAANSNLVFNVNTGGSMNWRVGNANAFTLSSASNLLIGTTIDGGQKLQVSGTAAATSFVVANSAGGGVIIGNSTGDYGSVGYNIAPTGTGGVYNYRVTDYASRIEFLQGGFKFKNAASGTAGNAITFTDALTIDSSQNATFAGTKMTMNSGASQSGQRQNLTSSITAAASTVSKKIAYVGPSHSVKVSILAVQDNSVAHVATFSGDFTTSYGSASTGGTTSAVVGNITAITVAYDNGGSPSYTINVTLTYTGNAPVIYYTIDGHSFNAIAAQ